MFSNSLALIKSFPPYITHKVMGSWMLSTNTLNPLKKLCEKDLDNWCKYINQALASQHVTPHLTTSETPLFLVYGRDPKLPLHQLLEPVQWLLSDTDSGHIDLKSHCLTLAIVMKTLDENWFKHAQKTINYTPPNFKVGDRVTFKISNLANGT